MLGLYLYTLIIGHKYCSILSILNQLTLKKKLQNFVTNNVLFRQKIKTQQQQNKKIKHENPCMSRDLNQGPLAPKADA